MKLCYACALIAALLLLTAHKPKTNPINIEGHLARSEAVVFYDTAGVAVFVKGGGRVLAHTISDGKGDFELSFLPHGEDSFDVFCARVGLDTLFLSSFTSFDSDLFYDTLFVPAAIKKDINGKVICPKCGKTDDVYGIVYSIAPIVTRRINKHGDTIYSPIYKGHYEYPTRCRVKRWDDILLSCDYYKEGGLHNLT